jgi:hypothetical protein
MKEFIVMSAMIILGIFICNLIIGNSDDSLLNVLEKFFRSEIDARAGMATK